MRQAYYERGREIVQAAPELLLDVDVEADGVAGYGSLLSIGAVSPFGETFYAELKPTSEISAPGYREVNEANGLHRERLMTEGRDMEPAIREFAEWARAVGDEHNKPGGIAFAGFNVSYDFPLVNLEFMKAGIESPFGHAGFCLKSLAMALPQGRYSWRQTAKTRLPADVLPEGDFTHHALEDAQYQQAIHFGIVGLLAAQWDAMPEALR